LTAQLADRCKATYGHYYSDTKTIHLPEVHLGHSFGYGIARYRVEYPFDKFKTLLVDAHGHIAKGIYGEQSYDERTQQAPVAHPCLIFNEISVSK
jgi:hypothetical protein